MCLIVILSGESSSTLPLRPRVRDWDEVLALGCDPDGFWIDPAWQGDLDALALRLRTSPWWDRLAFTGIPCTNPLLDGQARLEDAVTRCARAQLAKASLEPGPAHPIAAEKLLLYLYIRGSHELLPRYERSARARYAYPLVDVLGADEPDDDWFDQLVRGRLLSPVRLVDRIRVCRACGSGHLSFGEVCPACSSIDMRPAALLHCFTCGHVGRKPEFEGGAQPCCPKCGAHLRHIGVDYDMPAAQHQCAACGQVAPEPRVVATCFDCRNVDEPGKLHVREVHAWSLNWHGLDALRHGLACDAGSPQPHLPGAQFRQVLLWSTAALQRHGAMSFSLFLIEVANTDQLLVRYGAGAVHGMLDEFAGRMRAVLRGSDLTSVDAAQRLWVLLPLAAPSAPAERLLAHAQSVQPPGGPALDVRLRSMHAPRDLAGAQDPDSIMARLMAS